MNITLEDVVIAASQIKKMKKEAKGGELLKWFCFFNGVSFSKFLAAVESTAKELSKDAAKKKEIMSAIRYWKKNKKDVMHVFMMSE